MRGQWRARLGMGLLSVCFTLTGACNFADLEQHAHTVDDMDAGGNIREDMVITPPPDMRRVDMPTVTPADMGDPADLASDLGADMTIVTDMITPSDMEPLSDMQTDQGNMSPVCGNNMVEAGELCDGNCPATCSDGDMCTRDVRAGQDAQCNVVCSYPPITACTSNDGCCPAGCTDMQDNDCPSSGIDCKNAATWPSSWQSTANAAKVRVDQVRQSGMCNGTVFPSRGALARDAQLDQAARCVALWFQQHPDADQNQLLSEFIRAVGESGYQGSNVDVQFIGGRSTTAVKAEDRLFASNNNCQDISGNVYQDAGVAYLDTMPATSNHFVALVLGKKN